MCYSNPFPAVADYSSAPGLKSASPAQLSRRGLIVFSHETWLIFGAQIKCVVRQNVVTCWHGAVVVLPQIQAAIWLARLFRALAPAGKLAQKKIPTVVPVFFFEKETRLATS